MKFYILILGGKFHEMSPLKFVAWLFIYHSGISLYSYFLFCMVMYYTYISCSLLFLFLHLHFLFLHLLHIMLIFPVHEFIIHYLCIFAVLMSYYICISHCKLATGKCFITFVFLAAGVAFSSVVCGGVQYTTLLAIQICRCLHSTMGHGHFSLWTPIPECMHTGQQLSAADTTVLGHRESPLTHPSSLPTNRFLFT